MLEWTGERYLPFIDPSICGAEIHYEHLHRYAFASQYVKNKTVLDLASGEGFGTFILSKNARHVIGIDIDHEAIIHASNTYQKENIEFLEGSILDIPVEGKKIFDVIVCFEAIEHVKEHDVLFQEITRLLKDDGLLIISTPNKQTYSDETGYQNPFHQKELTYSEFYELLKRNFAFVYFSGQQVFSGSSISPVSSNEIASFSEFIVEFADNQFCFTGDERGLPRYFIAIASNIKLNQKEIQKSYLVDKSNTEISLLKSHIDQNIAAIRSLDQATAAKDQQMDKMKERVSFLDIQIAELSKHTHNLEAIVTDRDRQITDLKQNAYNLEAIVTDRDRQITELKQNAYNLEAIVTDRDGQITDLKQNAYNLEAIVTDRDRQITELKQHARNLETIVTDRDRQIIELKQHARNLETIVIDRDRQIIELRQHARNLEAIVTDRDQKLQEFIRFNQSLSNENQSIKQSLTYNLTTKFHKKIIDRLLPQNTRRRKYYNLGLSGSRLLVNEGWNRFWWCYYERKNSQALGTDHIIPIQPPGKEIHELDNLPIIQTKISVIIPTKNAGPDFPSVLEKIKNQKGIASVEIIIVDSGSTDGTREVAEKYECRIFLIKPEEFNHGLTRNYGAERANGEFIVFLVQDAIPIGDLWLYNMVKCLSSDMKIAAVTCRQVPRSDADPFAGFILWSHNKSLNRTRNMIYSCDTRFDELAPLDKRIAAGIEDTCCMMQKKIFDRFKFRNIRYGEDLDVGIRFLKAGNKTAFIFSTGVIHSHNRDAHYFFKRSFIDTLATASLLNDSQMPADTNTSLKDLIEQILGLYSLIHQSLSLTTNISFSGTQTLDLLKKSLQSSVIGPESHQFFSDCEQSESVDSTKKLEILLADCAKVVNAKSFKREDSFIASYCAVLDSFSEYCSVYSSLDGMETELYESFDKLFALIAGSTLATYYCKKSHNQLSESESALMKILEEGI
jgi:glycosyltransferase involved in cell wall biosynthesis/SAM-dependent methyltransferase